MRYLIKIILTMVCLALVVSPALALVTNVSASSTTLSSSSYLHDSKYMPTSYVYVLIIIGLLSLLASRVFETAEDIFSIGAVVPTALSAYWSNYMSIEYMLAAPLSLTQIGSNVQIIAPSAYLSLTMIVFTILSVLNVIWIFFLKKSDKATDGE